MLYNTEKSYALISLLTPLERAWKLVKLSMIYKVSKILCFESSNFIYFSLRISSLHFLENISQIAIQIAFVRHSFKEKQCSVRKAASSVYNSVIQCFKTTMTLKYTEEFYTHFPFSHIEYLKDQYARVEIFQNYYFLLPNQGHS